MFINNHQHLRRLQKDTIYPAPCNDYVKEATENTVSTWHQLEELVKLEELLKVGVTMQRGLDMNWKKFKEKKYKALERKIPSSALSG